MNTWAYVMHITCSIICHEFYRDEPSNSKFLWHPVRAILHSFPYRRTTTKIEAIDSNVLFPRHWNINLEQDIWAVLYLLLSTLVDAMGNAILIILSDDAHSAHNSWKMVNEYWEAQPLRRFPAKVSDYNRDLSSRQQGVTKRSPSAWINYSSTYIYTIQLPVQIRWIWKTRISSQGLSLTFQI